jgi:hypothetical protein
MTLTEALVFLFQFALVVILGTIVLVKWTYIAINLLWKLWARRRYR